MRGMTSSPSTVAPASAIDRFFKISERGSTIGAEIRGGLVTFLAMAYIIALNPLILGGVPDSTGAFLGGADDNLAKIAAVTALAAGVLSILMGLVANFPMALAAGLGLNAVVAFQIAGMPKMTWADAMGIVVLEGLVILVLVLTGFRTAVFKAVPRTLKTAISVGIGLFIALIGFVNAGFVRQGGGTPLELGIGGSLQTWPVVVFVVGLTVAVVLTARNVRGALLIAIVSATVVALVIEKVAGLGPAVVNPKGWHQNVPALDGSPVAVPDFSLVGNFSLFGAFGKIGVVSVLLLVFALLLADFFDTMGTMVAVGSEAKLLDADGNPPKATQILVVDSVAAAVGGMASASSNTSYVESTTGVAAGARTGLAAVVTGVCFLLATFLAPLVNLIPNEAAAPALVIVGYLMMTQVLDIDWKSPDIAIPAFLTLAIMPFAYSITAGIGVGFIAHVVIKTATGKVRSVHPLMWVASAMFVVYFTLVPLQVLLGI
ncbi:NCS2 family permease [Sanguibacter sp. HDW7]|uniref:NCS2 family permease n=1 Tax=Sanguibacter sp. HDW7 TaxID=2714931 RepID=UPI00140B11C2|nr:NCS2 family permease [Sanguibacter sp. HDW7]